MRPALELRRLSKRYGSRSALDDVSLAVAPGSVVGVIGPNGAGKTTMMRLILGLIRPAGGSVTVLGNDPWPGDPRLRRRIGYLPGELKLDGRITGADLLRHFSRISGPVDGRYTDELTERLGLDPSRRVGSLSKGNKQKIGLVQAFMHQPELLVLDEPTSGLDPLVQREFLALVREVKESGRTVFLSSHVISEVQQCADQVAVIRQGHLVRSATVSELRDEAPRLVRLELVGSLAPEAVLALQHAGLGILTTTPAPDAPTSTSSAPPRTALPTIVEGQVSGSPVALLGVLSGLGLTDIVIEEPDLEQAVLGLYEQAGPTAATGVHHVG